MPRAASGCTVMATDHDRLTTFFYLLTRGTDRRDGVSWGHVTRVIDDCLSMEAAIASDVAEALAREMARRLLGHGGQSSAQAGVYPPELSAIVRPWMDENHIAVRDIERAYHLGLAIGENDAKAGSGSHDLTSRQTLRDVADLLASVRAELTADSIPMLNINLRTVDAMIDRCNLAVMGVAYDGNPAPTPRGVLAGLGWRCVETEAIAGKAHELWSKAGADAAVRLTAWVSSAGVEADSDALLSPTELRAFAAHAESL
jgi:hypothetical protein